MPQKQSSENYKRFQNLKQCLFNIENFEIPESRERGAYCWFLQGGTQVRKDNSQFNQGKQLLHGKHVTKNMIEIASEGLESHTKIRI